MKNLKNHQRKSVLRSICVNQRSLFIGIRKLPFMTPAPSPPMRRLSSFYVLGPIMLMGLVLRLIRLDFQPLWWDEGYTVWFTAQPLMAMLARTAADIHPPLYYALLHGWAQAFGLNPLSLRGFSVLVSLPAIPLAYALGRDLRDRPTGYLAALLVAVNPMAIYYGQEVRMYGLAATWSLAALWTGWRWMHGEDVDQGEDAGRSSSHPWRWGLAYGISVVAGLYTLYVFVLLPMAQGLWVLLRRPRRWKAFLVTQIAAAVLYVPWALYAGPQLLAYVPNKVVKDHDTPLPLLMYLGRHLSAFLVGHLEGWARGGWAWALLLWLPPLIVWVWLQGSETQTTERVRSLRTTTGYLMMVLGVALGMGFLQQIRAPFIPEHFERVLYFAAPAGWLWLALVMRRLYQEARPAFFLYLLCLFLAQSLSLTAFYTTPRYAHRDYRPLIQTVTQNLRPQDSIFVIYPWQAGYFLAYLPSDLQPRLVNARADEVPTSSAETLIVLIPEPEWTPTTRHVLDALLQRGGIWFPEHLSLGGILETKVERYLDQRSFQLTNLWYGEETRLTGWDIPRKSPSPAQPIPAKAWEQGIHLVEGQWQITPYRIFLELTWQGEQPIYPGDLTYSLWLQGPDGQRWAQRDVTPFAHPWPPLAADPVAAWRNEDRIGLTLPAGLPPGQYALFMAVIRPDLSPLSTLGDKPAPQAPLGTVTLPHAVAVLPHPQYPHWTKGEGLDFLGYDRDRGPFLPGEDIPVTLYWRAHGPLRPDHLLFLQLIDKTGMVAGMEAPPLAWLPTSAWPDAPLRVQARLRVPADIPPGEYQLITGLFEPASGRRILWEGRDALRLGRVTIAPRAHDFQPPRPQHPLDLTLLGGHRLVGYDLVAQTHPAAPVNLVLYWLPAGPTPTRYKVFVHLVDPEGHILAQDDREPGQGEHPTTSWLAGETITDPHTLSFPITDHPGPYGLEVGLYDPITGRRVPFVDETGRIVTDHITLPLFRK